MNSRRLIIVISGSLLFIICFVIFIKASPIFSDTVNDRTVGDPSALHNLRPGDIIFQKSYSEQGRTFHAAHGCEYTHCGIVYRSLDSYAVFEAADPVRITPIEEWIARGDGEKFVAKRLVNANELLLPGAMDDLKKESGNYLGQDYDDCFTWDEENGYYSSELVWKLFKNVLDVELAPLQKYSELDLSSSLLRYKLQKLYGENIPMDQNLVTPMALFNSDKLKTVLEN